MSALLKCYEEIFLVGVQNLTVIKAKERFFLAISKWTKLKTLKIEQMDSGNENGHVSLSRSESKNCESTICEDLL